MTNSHATARSA